MEKYNERENYLLDLNKILGPKLRKKLPRFVINFLKRRIHEDDVNHVVMTVEHYKGVEFFDEALNLPHSWRGTLGHRHRQEIYLRVQPSSRRS